MTFKQYVRIALRNTNLKIIRKSRKFLMRSSKGVYRNTRKPGKGPHSAIKQQGKTMLFLSLVKVNCIWPKKVLKVSGKTSRLTLYICLMSTKTDWGNTGRITCSPTAREDLLFWPKPGVNLISMYLRFFNMQVKCKSHNQPTCHTTYPSPQPYTYGLVLNSFAFAGSSCCLWNNRPFHPVCGSALKWFTSYLIWCIVSTTVCYQTVAIYCSAPSRSSTPSIAFSLYIPHLTVAQAQVKL